MFEFLKEVVNGTIDTASELAKGVSITVTSVVTEWPAAIIDNVAGEDNILSNGLRSLQNGILELTDGVVDGVAPVLKTVGHAPIAKTQRIADFGIGVLEGFGGNADGFDKAGRALQGMAVIALTAGLGADLADNIDEYDYSDTETFFSPDHYDSNDFNHGGSLGDNSVRFGYAVNPYIDVTTTGHILDKLHPGMSTDEIKSILQDSGYDTQNMSSSYIEEIKNKVNYDQS